MRTLFSMAILAMVAVGMSSVGFAADQPSAQTDEPANSSSPPEPTDPLEITNSTGASVVVGTNGVYSVTFGGQNKSFVGSLAQEITNRSNNSDKDGIGEYDEIKFSYMTNGSHMASIRLYKNEPIVLFCDNTLSQAANDRKFPALVADTSDMKHLSFGDTAFGVYNFNRLYDYTGSPWIFFDKNYNTFILSPAANYLVAANGGTGAADRPFTSGIDARITSLPENFTQKTILVADKGIDKTIGVWGNALQKMVGRKAPANDAAVEINKLSYWTDNGAGYYYAGPPVEAKMVTMRDEFAAKGVPIGSIQLDSWFYPKGNNSWRDVNSGFYLYEADPNLFPDKNGNGDGLDDFAAAIKVPIIVHNRWVDNDINRKDGYISPYVAKYKISKGVVIDPEWWDDRMAYLAKNGVSVYEQDWISFRGEAELNLEDPFAFFDNMAKYCQKYKLTMQYCMVNSKHILQGVGYPNLMTTRCSEDDWNTTRWKQFMIDSHYIRHLGVWPWTDVCMSAETRNMLLSTLSAGPVGPGDKAGNVSAENINKVARPDSVIVKPDVSIRPLDKTYVNEAWRLGGPFVAATYTDFGGLRPLYVFAFGSNRDSSSEVNLSPAELGMNSDAYIYDYFAGTGTLVKAGKSYVYNTTVADNFNGGTYHIVAPMGSSGVALIGDTGKFVTLGKKRISQLTDNGTLTAKVVFAAGEKSVVLTGYCSAKPSVSVGQGSGKLVSYDQASGLFTAEIAPDTTGTAVVKFSGK